MPAYGDVIPGSAWSLLGQVIGLFASVGFSTWFVAYLNYRRAGRTDRTNEARQGKQEDYTELRSLVDDMRRDREESRARARQMEDERNIANQRADSLMEGLRSLHDYCHKLVHQANGKVQRVISILQLVQSGVMRQDNGMEFELPVTIPSPPPLESFIPKNST